VVSIHRPEFQELIERAVIKIHKARGNDPRFGNAFNVQAVMDLIKSGVDADTANRAVREAYLFILEHPETIATEYDYNVCRAILTDNRGMWVPATQALNRDPRFGCWASHIGKGGRLQERKQGWPLLFAHCMMQIVTGQVQNAA